VRRGVATAELLEITVIVIRASRAAAGVVPVSYEDFSRYEYG